jgi:hypothetical protein
LVGFDVFRLAEHRLGGEVGGLLAFSLEEESADFREAFEGLGVVGIHGAPSQRVSMLSWMRSSATPPKIIAPRRPLPSGRASVHSRAGLRYQRSFSPTGSLGHAGNGGAVVPEVFLFPFVEGFALGGGHGFGVKRDKEERGERREEWWFGQLHDGMWD